MRPFETEKVRCTGHCCRAFFLPYSYEQLQAKKADGSSCKYMGCTRKTECDRASMDQLSKEIKAVEQVLKPHAKMGASWGARCRQWLASCWRS